MNKLYSLYISQEKYEAELLSYLYILTLPILLFLSYIDYTKGLKFLVFMDSIVIFILSLGLYLFKKNIAQDVAKSLMLFSLLLSYINILFYGDIINGSFFWFFIFILLSFLLFNKKSAFIWIAILILSVLVSILLSQLSLVQVSYDTDILYILALALALETYIISYSHKVLVNYKEGAERLFSDLTLTNNFMNKYMVILRTDLEGRIVHVNDTFLRLTSFEEDELLGKPYFELCMNDGSADLVKEYFNALERDEHYDIVIKCKKEDGSSYWAETHMDIEHNEKNEGIGVLIFQQDITQRMDLEKLNVTDYLTQVNNRAYFDMTLDLRISEYKKYDIISSLIICDIDGLKEINFKHGYNVGDEILQAVAKLLKKNMRKEDTLSRLNGGKFSILLPETQIDKAVFIAQKMHESIKEYSFDFDAEVSVHFGVSMIKKHDTTITWSDRADKAQYLAKESEVNKVYSF